MERRSYYRINDTVGLRFSVLDDASKDLPADAVLPGAPVAGQLAALDGEFNQLANLLWQENPLIAQALGLLNRKLSLLTEHALMAAEDGEPELKEWVVSISGSGLGFKCNEALPVRTRLALSLWLRPSNIDLHLTGVVTGCEGLADETADLYWVRVAFEKGNEAAQERLIQHVVQRQCALGGERDRVPDA